VLGIVKTHHGFVTVETEVGQGTTFRVYLPATDPGGPVATDRTENSPARGSGELILLVDDEETIRSVGGAILTANGYSVLTASDGTEAIALFTSRAQEVALVITDLDMPNLDGPGLARVLHRLRPGLKILAMSGLAGDRLKNPEKRTAEFAADFIEKPFTATRMLNMVGHLLHGDPMP
jgi:two-component system cell cycle sensor histidine kinase/response regulator CckA